MELKELKKENSLIKKPGHTIFKFEVETGYIMAADVVDGVVVKEPGCLYCSALNLKNADRHFSRAVKKVLSR